MTLPCQPINLGEEGDIAPNQESPLTLVGAPRKEARSSIITGVTLTVRLELIGVGCYLGPSHPVFDGGLRATFLQCWLCFPPLATRHRWKNRGRDQGRSAEGRMSCHPFGRTRKFHGMRNWTELLIPYFCCYPYIIILVPCASANSPEADCIRDAVSSHGVIQWSSEVIHMFMSHIGKVSYTEFFPPVTFRPRPTQRLDRRLRGSSDWTPDNPAFTLY